MHAVPGGGLDNCCDCVPCSINVCTWLSLPKVSAVMSVPVIHGKTNDLTIQVLNDCGNIDATTIMEFPKAVSILYNNIVTYSLRLSKL